MNIAIKRIYEPFSPTDGYRILVDRLWPRGIKKENAHIDIWIKEVAPSTELRKWFNHDPNKQDEFRIRYQAEIKGSSAFDELLQLVREHKTVTFLYASKEEHYNHAIVLRQFVNDGIWRPLS
jgi:uncharacterized protein YeaO (DUF488 family)